MSETQIESYEPVKVHVANLGELAGPTAAKPHSYEGKYETFQLTANDPVQCILPEDPDRVEAYVWSLDNDVLIGTKQQVQAANNTVSSVPYPIGAYLPAKTTAGVIEKLPVKDCQAVFAGVTTTASNSRVCVAAYYRC